MYAAVMVRGTVSCEKRFMDTLTMLRLTRINHCVLLPQSKSIDGMLKKVKFYVTWGEVSDGNIEKLVAKWGRLPGRKRLEEKDAKEIAALIRKDNSLKNVKGMLPVFRLGPPDSGYRDTRAAFPKGELGYRGEKINGLLERMM